MSTFFVILHDAEPADAQGRANLRENLESKLGLRPNRIEQIFESLPVILKENMQEADADSYVRVLERLGASVEKLSEASGESELPQPPESSTTDSAVTAGTAEDHAAHFLEETESSEETESDEHQLNDLEASAAKAKDPYELDLDADYSLEDLEGLLDEALGGEPSSSEAPESGDEPIPSAPDEPQSLEESSMELEFNVTETDATLHTSSDKPVLEEDVASSEDFNFDALELAPEPKEDASTLDTLLENDGELEEDLEDYSASLSAEIESDEISPLDTTALDALEVPEEFGSAAETLSTLSQELDLPEEEDSGFEDQLIARLESGEEEENRLSAQELSGVETQGEAELGSETGAASTAAVTTSSGPASSASEDAVPEVLESKTAQLVSRATIWIGAVLLLLGVSTLVFVPDILGGVDSSEENVRFDPAPGMIQALLEQQAAILGRGQGAAKQDASDEAKPEVGQWSAERSDSEELVTYSAKLLTVNGSPAFMQLEASTKKPVSLTAEELVAGVSRPWLHKINAPNLKLVAPEEDAATNSIVTLEGSARGYIDDRGHRGRLLLEIEAQLGMAKGDVVEGVLEIRHGSIAEKLREHEGETSVHYVGRPTTESYAVLIRTPFLAKPEIPSSAPEEEVKETEKKKE